MHANIAIREIANGFLVAADAMTFASSEETATFYADVDALKADAANIIATAIEKGREAKEAEKSERDQAIASLRAYEGNQQGLQSGCIDSYSARNLASY